MSPAHRSGPAVVALLILTETVGIVWFFKPGLILSMFLYLLSGAIFGSSRIITGGSLDQPSLHKYLFAFCFIALLIIPGLGAIHWLANWQRKSVRIIYRLLSFPLLLLPFCLLSEFCIHLFRYVQAMGLTNMRFAGILIGISGYLVLFGIWIRLWRNALPAAKAGLAAQE